MDLINVFVSTSSEDIILDKLIFPPIFQHNSKVRFIHQYLVDNHHNNIQSKKIIVCFEKILNLKYQLEHGYLDKDFQDLLVIAGNINNLLSTYFNIIKTNLLELNVRIDIHNMADYLNKLYLLTFKNYTYKKL